MTTNDFEHLPVHPGSVPDDPSANSLDEALSIVIYTFRAAREYRAKDDSINPLEHRELLLAEGRSQAAIAALAESHAELLDKLCGALPFVEGCAAAISRKERSRKMQVREIKEAIARAERVGGE